MKVGSGKHWQESHDVEKQLSRQSRSRCRKWVFNLKYSFTPGRHKAKRCHPL